MTKPAFKTREEQLSLGKQIAMRNKSAETIHACAKRLGISVSQAYSYQNKYNLSGGMLPPSKQAVKAIGNGSAEQRRTAAATQGIPSEAMGGLAILNEVERIVGNHFEHGGSDIIFANEMMACVLVRRPRAG